MKQASNELRPDELKRKCDPSIFSFETTEEVASEPEIIGQDRTVKDLLRHR